MRAVLPFLAALLLSGPGGAQQGDVDAPAPAPAPAEGEVVDARGADGKPYRYPMPAVAETVRDLQHSTQAMLLREYCADKRIPDDFVNRRLAEFSRQTGRDENCRTLLEY